LIPGLPPSAGLGRRAAVLVATSRKGTGIAQDCVVVLAGRLRTRAELVKKHTKLNKFSNPNTR
jgi:hypothetical protein